MEELGVIRARLEELRQCGKENTKECRELEEEFKLLSNDLVMAEIYGDID